MHTLPAPLSRHPARVVVPAVVGVVALVAVTGGLLAAAMAVGAVAVGWSSCATSTGAGL